MKTYKQISDWLYYIDNKTLREFVGWDTPEVAPIATSQAVDDVDSAAFSVEKPEILEKLNAYCHDIANHQYMNPYYPINTLWRKLMLIGIQFDMKKILMTGDHGRVEVPLVQYGGRYGVLGAPNSYVSSDDGTRVPGGLNLVVNYVKTGGVYTLDAAIEQGMQSTAVGFGEEVVTEDELAETHLYTHKIYTGPTIVKDVANKLHKMHPNVKAGTEHVYVHTDHPAESMLGSMKKIGSGWGPRDIQTKTHSEGKKKVTESLEHTLATANEHGYTGKKEKLSGPAALMAPEAHVLAHPSNPKKKLLVFANGAWRHNFQTGSDAGSLHAHLKKK